MTSSSRVLCASALLSFATLSAGCELMMARPRAQASDRWEKTYDVNAGARLEIENTNGAISVTTHDAPSFAVVAHRIARAATEQDARAFLSQVRLEASATADAVRLVTPRAQGFGSGPQVDVTYEVRVPAGSGVTLTTVNGRIAVEGVTGPLAVETVNGGIEARQVTGLTRANTVNGSVRLALTALPRPGGVHVETVNGSVTIALPPVTSANVSVRTVNGGIAVDGFVRMQEGERRRRHYEGTVNGGGPVVRVETVNGSVSVTGKDEAATPSATAEESR